jgi:hypothetical protein
MRYVRPYAPRPMEYTTITEEHLEEARRRYPEGSRAQVVSGRYRGEVVTVEGIDEGAFLELGELVVWVDRGSDGQYVPASVMHHELAAVR